MAISITIGNTVIDFPTSASDPNWAPPVIEFALAVQDALAILVGPFDVPPTVMIIDPYDVVTDQPITDTVNPLAFPVVAFPGNGPRGAFIRYTVFRTSTATTVTEIGQLSVVYNPASVPTWEIQRDYVGDAHITFTIDSTGQVKFSTTTIGGISHVGRITYVAQALKQS